MVLFDPIEAPNKKVARSMVVLNARRIHGYILETESWESQLSPCRRSIEFRTEICRSRKSAVFCGSILNYHTQPEDFPGSSSQSTAMPTKRIPRQA